MENRTCSKATEKDQEMMKYLLWYALGRPFPLKHNVMEEEADAVYGIRRLNPSDIFENTEGKKKNTRYLVTFQKRETALVVKSKVASGIWKPSCKDKPIFDHNNRRMGFVKISWYYYYCGRDKSSLRKSEWHMREYYLTHKYLPPKKAERKDVLFTMMIKTKEQKANNNDQDEMQLDDQGISTVDKQITQSLLGLQLQNS